MSDAWRVLTADDSLLMQKMMKRCFDGSEFDLVGTVGNGKLAVEEFERLRPDVVLLDIVMPEMTGNEALKAILAIDPTARVVMVTSLATQAIVQECLDLGARRFVVKPVQKDVLLATLREVIKR